MGFGYERIPPFAFALSPLRRCRALQRRKDSRATWGNELLEAGPSSDRMISATRWLPR